MKLLNVRYYFAVLFNLMFAILSSVTLIGIVFITKPKQVMHNIPPSWWIPLMLIMVPSQLAVQFLTFKTIYKRQVPSPLAIARNQPTLFAPLRPAVAVVWGVNFIIGFVIVVSLYKPGARRNPDIFDILIIVVVGFALTIYANNYLMLLTRTLTTKEATNQFIWDARFAIDAAIATVGVIYYQLLF